MNKWLISLLVIAAVFLVFQLVVSMTTSDIETPKYKVLKKYPRFELRQYESMMLATTNLGPASYDEKASEGFRTVASYIFGKNKSNEKIAMTAPVTAEPQSSELHMQNASKWRIHFVMPSQYTLANIPKPKNDAITLREVPSKFFLVHSYSGFNTLARVQVKTDEALAWATRKSLKVLSPPQLSRYDPPWTLPVFRRNEIMLEVAAP